MSEAPRQVAVVGLGLMGASFAAALKKARPELRLLGVDRDEAVLQKALARGHVDAASPDLELALAADAVFVAVPLRAMAEVLAGLAGHSGTVTDMASVKGPVMELARGVGLDLVGGHPMCGRELGGIDSADPSIFENATWVLTRRDEAVEELVKAVGAHPLELEPELHDRLVAGISHAAFAVSVAYTLAMTGSPDWPRMAELAAGGFRDTSRLASQDPAMYAELALTNREALIERIDDVAEQLARLRRHLERNDARLVELMEEAKTARDRWLKERENRARQG